jgi:hypothetical protein
MMIEILIGQGWRLAQVSFHSPNSNPKDAAYGSWLFLVKAPALSVENFEQRLRLAAVDWSKREREAATRDQRHWPDHNENWGDFVVLCPPEILMQHGLHLVHLPLALELSLQVDHDEVLAFDRV